MWNSGRLSVQNIIERVISMQNEKAIKASDVRVLLEIKEISKKGNSAEVRLKNNGEWHLLEVEKHKKEIKAS